MSAVLCAVISLGAAAQEEQPDLLAPQTSTQKHASRKPKPEEHTGPRPAVEISLQPLGFAAPASFYLGGRVVQSSLNFLDENRLLFTFRVPGLIARDHASSGDAGNSSDERTIRALVLSLPSGRIEVESLWHLHDFATYVWPLSGGHFLLRDRNLVQIGSKDLNLEPFLRFAGNVRYLEVDPQRKILVTQNYERQPASANTDGPSNNAIAGEIASNGSSSSSGGSVLPDSSASTDKREKESATYLRVLKMDDHQVLITTRLTDGIVHLPIDGDGYYDAIRARGFSWQIVYRTLGGAEVDMLPVDSVCTPPIDVIAPGIVLVSACNETGGRHLVVLTRDKRRLWDTQVQPTHVWPLVVHSENGLRLARATLDLPHSITAGSPLDPTDIHSQTIQVFDVATGRVAITGPASPVLDGGGNFALSPSGNRFAVLNQGSIQVYDLPPAPPIPIPPMQ